MRSNTKVVFPTPRPEPLPPDAVWDRVDPLAPDAGTNPAEALIALPYLALGGPGFERLIYELLQAANQRPWFFGRSGQKQYGADIVTEIVTNTHNYQSIYQCKNEAEAPKCERVRDAVHKFESEWLVNRTLPAPKEFVYCCPHALNDRTFNFEWINFKKDFQQRTGVTLLFLDKEALDSKLRLLPDLVAGLFSDSCAEYFCSKDNWRDDDPWTRLHNGATRFRGVDRFLNRHTSDAIYVTDSHKEQFLAALDQGSLVVLRGLPGIGKTFLALELACRLRDPIRRVYYATFKDRVPADRLWKSAVRRLSLPAVFVLDDCHLSSEETEKVLERLNPEVIDGKLKFVLILRDQTQARSANQDDSPAWLTQLDQEKVVINMCASMARTWGVACRLRSDFINLSPALQRRLHNACGGDLLLLDELLKSLSTPHDINTQPLDSILARLRIHYFGSNRRLPTISRLAALAQYDLVPRSNFFKDDWQPGEKRLADPLMTELFGPPRYQFLHSSLAELVFRALTQLDVGNETLNDGVILQTIRTLRAYLLHLDQGALILTLQQCLEGKLNLLDSSSDARIKTAVLDDAKVKDALGMHVGKDSLAILSLCASTLANASHPATSHYLDLVEDRFRALFKRANDCDSEEITTMLASESAIGTLNMAMNVLFRVDPERLGRLENSIGIETFLRFILTHGTLLDLFKILENATSDFRESLLQDLSCQQANVLLDRTIATGRSIGMLDLSMRVLGTTSIPLLARIESTVGGEGFFRLILANGTLVDLFKNMANSTPSFKLVLLDQLTSEKVEALLNKTISSGSSIGTLNLAMRELRAADPNLLDHLEASIGPDGFLRLILANGTLYELFHILKHSAHGFRQLLIERLTPDKISTLLETTITAGRSIGTLTLAMRELRGADPELLGRLEMSIGAAPFLKLILANGTLVEQFKTLEHATPTFREALLEQLTSKNTAALIDKTIASGRSISTLCFAMRELRGADSELLNRLERSVGADGFLRLILANGSLFDLFRVLQYATPTFRIALLRQITSAQASILLDKTVAGSRSIESFHFTLEALSRNSEQLHMLEEVIGIDGWWKLFTCTGSLNSLSQITNTMSINFRAQVIDASSGLSITNWSAIIERGLFLNACDFVTNELHLYPARARAVFRAGLQQVAEALARRATWFDINPSIPPTDPGHVEGAILQAALRTRGEEIKLIDLYDLDFREAVNAFAFCWRQRPDLRSALGSNFRKILLPPDIWPRKKGEIAALSIIFVLARDLTFPEEEAQLLLAQIKDYLDQQVCESIPTWPLFLLVWNMAAMSFERSPKRSFSDAFPATAPEFLLTILKNRVKLRGQDKENLGQIAFGGLLFFLFPQNRLQLIQALAPLESTVHWLRSRAMEQRFVQAFFILEGIALVTNQQRTFTPANCGHLLKKYEEYDNIGPSIEVLRLLVSQIE